MDWFSLRDPHTDAFWAALLVVAAVGGALVGVATNTGLFASAVAVALVAVLLAARAALSVCAFLDERCGDTLRQTTPWLAAGLAAVAGGAVLSPATGGSVSEGAILGLSLVLYAYVPWLVYRLWSFAVGAERTT